MPVLLPFRAFHSSTPTVYIPGEEPPRSTGAAALIEDDEPALFIYRQRFRFPGDREESVRDGVMGLLNRAEAKVFPHEETFPGPVHLVDADPGSLWLWCDDSQGALAPLLDPRRPASIETTDRFGCLHQIWPIRESDHIRDLQSALAGKALFLADGHHRFAAGWNLATIQIRNASLRTLPSHRLVIDASNVRLPATRPVEGLAPSGPSRAVVVTRGPVFREIELPLNGAVTQPIRHASEAIAAVQSGRAEMALLVSPFTIDQIEADARRGILLPPKSTDFYPKLAAGLVIYRHQNENVTPPVAQRPGVRKPSS